MSIFSLGTNGAYDLKMQVVNEIISENDIVTSIADSLYKEPIVGYGSVYKFFHLWL